MENSESGVKPEQILDAMLARLSELAIPIVHVCEFFAPEGAALVAMPNKESSIDSAIRLIQCVAPMAILIEDSLGGDGEVRDVQIGLVSTVWMTVVWPFSKDEGHLTAEPPVDEYEIQRVVEHLIELDEPKEHSSEQVLVEAILNEMRKTRPNLSHGELRDLVGFGIRRQMFNLRGALRDKHCAEFQADATRFAELLLDQDSTLADGRTSATLRDLVWNRMCEAHPYCPTKRSVEQIASEVRRISNLRRV